MLQLGSYRLDRHALFFRDGDIITIPDAGSGSVAGASSRTNKPDPTDPLYLDLGAIDDWDDSGIKSAGDEKIYKSANGVRQVWDIVEKGVEGMLKITSQEMSAYAVECFYRSATKLTNAGGAQVFNPLSGQPRKGWLHCEGYDQSNIQGMKFDLYGLLRITGGMASKEGSLLKPQFEFHILLSNLNVASAQ